jgi:hypothetical protein
MATEG